MFSAHDQAGHAGRPSSARSYALRAAAVAAVAGLVLAACGSHANNSSNKGSGTSSPSTAANTSGNPMTELAALEHPPTGSVSLTEDGSSLLYPLYQAWVTGFHKLHPNITSSSGADGSGTGITDAETGTTDIGASDAYLPPATFTQFKTIENIPTAISAQMVNYNLPGFQHKNIKLSGTVLTGMYSGTIKKWNDPAIAKLNPGVKLPDIAVVPVHRSDSSGDTFLFTSYLAASDPASFAAKEGASPSATFPAVSGALGEEKNSGMVAGCGQTKGCVAYIGISYKSDTTKAGLGEAMLQNKSGNFELPSTSTIKAEAASFTSVPANGAISLIYGPASGGYPIINFEYLVVKTNQSSTSKAQALKAFLAWDMSPTGGNAASYLDPVGFQPLPSSALAVSVKLLQKIS